MKILVSVRFRKKRRTGLRKKTYELTVRSADGDLTSVIRNATDRGSLHLSPKQQSKRVVPT